MSTTRCKRRVWIAALIAAAALCAGPPAMAGAVPFTWDPAGAAPPLPGPGSVFTADTFSLNSSLRSEVQPGGGPFVARRLETITGFSLNGSPVAPAGFGSSYGLYLDLADTGFNPSPQIVHFTSVNVTLKADPGNRNGAALANASGIGFANTGPTGEADDIVLASGSMATASATLDLSTGMRDVPDLVTFAPAAGQAGFFLSPALDGSVLLEFLASSLPVFVNATLPDGTLITIFNNSVSSAQFVPAPEPGSIGLLAAGLLGLAPLLRRSRR